MSLRLQTGITAITWTFFTVALHHGCSMVSRACWWCYSKIFSAKMPNNFHNTARNNPKTGTAEWVRVEVDGIRNGKPKLVALPGNLRHLVNKSPESILKDLRTIYSDQKERDRFPNGPVLPVPVFVDSMSDFFHQQNDEGFLIDAVETMGQLSDKFHFQILTKRTQRMLEFSQRHPFPDGIWAGTTCETTDRNCVGQNYLWQWDDSKKKSGHAVPVKGCPANWYNHNEDGVAPWERPYLLAEVDAKVRFLSIEPMTGPIELPDHIWKRIDWVIIGGESDGGNQAQSLIRLCDLRKELNDLLRQCELNKVPVWFKQWGSYDEQGNYLGGHGAAGHKVDGLNIYNWPKYYLDAQTKGKVK